MHSLSPHYQPATVIPFYRWGNWVSGHMEWQHRAVPPVTQSPAISPVYLLLETRASPGGNSPCTTCVSTAGAHRVLLREPRPARPRWQTWLLSGPLTPLTTATIQSMFGIPTRLPDNQPGGALGSLPWSKPPTRIEQGLQTRG